MSELIHIISRCGSVEGCVGSKTTIDPKFRPIRQVAMVSVRDGDTKPLTWVKEHMAVGAAPLVVGPKRGDSEIVHHIYALPDGYMPTCHSYPTCAVKIVTETSFREHWHQLYSDDVHEAVHRYLFP